MERKIKGYKCPTDLWNGDISKGTLYVKKGNKNYGISGDISDNFNMPKEIVEQWEVVYEDEFKVGDWVVWHDGYIGKINFPCDSFPNCWNIRLDGKKGGDYSSCHKDYLRLATPEEIKSVQTKTIAAIS